MNKAKEPVKGVPLGRATVEDVARLAGVSTKTVSRVISGAPNVAPETRAKVERAVAALKFRANTLARELRGGGLTTTVGLVVGELTNPFYSSVAAGAERVLARAGLTLLMSSTEDEPPREATVVEAMLERRVRALLLVPSASDHSYLAGESERGTPVVAVDRPIGGVASDSVVFDNRGGAFAGALALLDAGHDRIAFVGSASTLYTDTERLRGFLDALEARRVGVDANLIRTDAPGVIGATAAARELLDSEAPPTGILAANNRASTGILAAVWERGCTVGLVGFDDFEFAQALGISVIAHDPEKMGERAAELALARMDDPMLPIQNVVLPTHVVLRGSEKAAARMTVAAR